MYKKTFKTVSFKECIDQSLPECKEHYHIFIAPENFLMGYTLCSILKKCKKNFSITISSHQPQIIWNFITTFKYDLWIISMTLSNKTCGLSLVVEFLEKYPDVETPPILFVGGNGKLYKEYLKFKELYPQIQSEYLLKPFTREKMIEKLNKLLKL